MAEQKAPVEQRTREAFAGPLLHWYRANRRDLPWRRRLDDPYAIWVSEIMLQQTQVATVIPYFERWMERFPTVGALAAAALEDVLRAWAGLGYYARARNLHRAAQMVAAEHGGRLPSDPEQLATLPGIGRYTSGAIRSIAFQQPAPIVDANVIRVLTRVFGIDGDPRSGPVQEHLWSLAEALIPPHSARDFSQAVMELGARVCTPADPACEHCPLLAMCVAGSSPDPTAWPQNAPGRPTVRVVHSCAVLTEGREVLVVQRPQHGLWGGMWEFPRRVCEPGEDPSACAVRAALEVIGVEVQVGRRLVTVRHAVTHHAITLHAYLATVVSGDLTTRDCAALQWVERDTVKALPLPAPQALVADAVAGDAGQQELALG